MALWAAWEEADRKRALMFCFAVTCGLASGSNYVYSAYAPQLANQLHLSSTQINVIGTAGNMGLITGPLWGKLVDTTGHRIPLLVGGLLVFSGYAYIHACYTLTIPIRSTSGGSEPASTIGLFFLCVAMFLTNCGGVAGLAAAINAVAKSFSDEKRATTTGAVLAGYGLSAFTFSTIGHLIFGGDSAGLLLLLAFGTGIPLIIASFVIRPYPPAGMEGYQPLNNGPDPPHESTHDTLSRIRSTSFELSRSRSPGPRGRNLHARSGSSAPHPKRSPSPYDETPIKSSFSPMELTKALDFWLIFVILSILCGTGLMYINNAGTVALALGREGQLEYDVHQISAWQAKQVATISVWNCIGRVVAGVASDFCKTRFHIQRIWFLPLVAAGFVTSQVAAMDITDVRHLWLVSTLLGLSYGSMFNVLPMLVLEWFGMQHFGQNWGWAAISPVIGGNIFNMLFGRIYDSNTIGHGSAVETDVTTDIIRLLRRGASIPDDSAHDCLIGLKCYSAAFRVSAMGCFVAFGLSVFAGFRRERRGRASIRQSDDQE